jgi:hypothetical protein
MKQEDWNKLCHNIFEKKCILLIGQDFPIKLLHNNSDEITCSKLLSNLIIKNLNDNPNISAEKKAAFSQKDMPQLAGDFIKYTKPDKKIARNDLEFLITDYLDSYEETIVSPEFRKLAELPFTFVVDTNFGNIIFNEFTAVKKHPGRAFYNFRGKREEIVRSFSPDSLGSETSPFIYNLFGSIDDQKSMVISENELIDFIINLISKNPGLPANVKSELADSDRYFLFLGFGIVSKNWYFRILLQALESSNKGSMSYALESINDIPDYEDPTIVFFRDELKLSLYYYNQDTFIQTLIEKYAEYEEKKRRKLPSDNFYDDAPNAFISYKSEDLVIAQQICQQLKELGINTYLDRERLKGMWEPTLKNAINTTDAFILLQSESLKNSPENYVHVEIKIALKRAHKFQKTSDLIYPAFIDSRKSILDYEELNEVNSWDLTHMENVDKLAKEIKRNYERLKRRKG